MANNNIFERHPKVFLTLVVTITIVFLDFIFGTAYKFVVGEPWSQATLNRNIIGERAFRVRSDIYHHGLVPNVNLIGRWGTGRYQFATDSLGFKNSAPQDIPLDSGARRILLIGDSFTEGVGVPYKDTFAGLFASGVSGQNVEVLNAGVVGYSPTIYYNKIKYLIEQVGLKFDEVFIFVDVSDAVDELGAYYYFDDKGGIAGRIPPGVPDTHEENLASGFLMNNSILLHFVYQVFIRNIDDEIKNLFAKADVGRINQARSLWAVSPQLFERYGKEGLGLMEDKMVLLRELLREQGISLTVAVYPWPDQIVHDDLDSQYARYWQEWCRNYQVDFLNYFPDFIQANNAKKDHNRILNQYFIKGDVHWNKAGHRLIADKLIAYYTQRHPPKAPLSLSAKGF